jgi:hypothetical protein
MRAMIASSLQDALNHVSKPLAYPLAMPSSFSLQHVKYASPAATNPQSASINDTSILAPQPPVVTPRDERQTIELSAASFSHVELPEVVASETGKSVVAQVSSDDGNGKLPVLFSCQVHLTRS